MKRSIKILALSMISLCSIGAVTVSTVAWFSTKDEINYVDGGAVASYFKSGHGTEQDPYIIASRNHVYNLAWLQYIGYFSDPTNFSGLHQYYFEVENDIDMEGLTIPPIGTEKYPFLGHFDGNGNTISNFTISNDNPAPDNSDFGVAKPINLYDGEIPDVVGFFGVVGQLPDQSITYDSSIVSASNITLKDFTVKARTSQVLIGLAAGYVNGEMSNFNIDGSATLDVNGQTSTAKSSITSNLSDYGLVGYTNQSSSTGEYSQKLSEFYSNYDTATGGQGQGDNYGGSINIRSLNMRIFNMLNAPNNIKTDNPETQHPTNTSRTSNITLTKGKTISSYNSYHRYYYDDYNYVAISGPADSTNLNTTPDNNTRLYRLAKAGTYKQGTSGTSTNGTFESPGTILPLAVGDKVDGYPTLASNTGYIMGGMTGSGNYSGQTTVRTSSSHLSQIGNSVSNAGPSTSGGVSYVQSQLEIITTTNATSYNASNFGRIEDSYNSNNDVVASAMETKFASRTVLSSSLNHYDDDGDKEGTRSQINDVFSGQSYINGLHFTGNNVSRGDTISIPRAVINRSTIDDYEMPNNSIDFHLKRHGSVNFYAGTYQHNSTTTTDSFFSLNIVQRDASNNLTKIAEITKIYENTNNSTKTKFPYVYDCLDEDEETHFDYAGKNEDGSAVSFTKGTIVFDMQYLWETPPLQGALYYFEIPVNSGEYAMGSHLGKSAGAYLVYLDIGTSGALNDKLDAYSIIHKRTGNDYPFGVDFIPTSVAGNGGESLAVSIASSKKGVLTFVVATSSITVTDSSTIASYVYRSTKYVASNPSINQFTVTGLAGAPPGVTAGGTRILNIGLEQASTGNKYHIQIVDQLTSDAGAFTEANSTYTIEQIVNDVGQGATPTTLSAINSLIALTGKNVNVSLSDADSLRNLVCPAVTLTRRAGSTSEFHTTYDLPNCSYEGNVVAVNIETNGTSMDVAVTNGYTFKIGGTTIANGSIYPAS